LPGRSAADDVATESERIAPKVVPLRSKPRATE
jgi:hypothetical protein